MPPAPRLPVAASLDAPTPLTASRALLRGRNGNVNETHAHKWEPEDRRGDEADRLTVWQRCSVCGLGLRRRYLKGILYEVRLQVTRLGDWVDPLELLARPNPYEVCHACRGRRDGCRMCRGLGVLTLPQGTTRA